ncbi:MAG: sugar isomerase [Clostridia bacterium]|nr:sugar isomerase [Clostridia bacterium]
MRKKKLAKNTISSFVLQITVIICGFIVPRLILGHFGSDVNGLVNSITQFLSIVTFMEFGVGTVLQSSLYKPLADHDNEEISKMFVSGHRFFRKIGNILLGYVVVLFFIYPFISNSEFGFIYTGTLIVAMSISTFAQYYFGLAERILLSADQRGYVQNICHIVLSIANTLSCVVLIRLNAPIQIVKLATSLIYAVRPLVLRIYVDRHYTIDRKIEFEGEPIKQKWDGVAQHLASILIDGTDHIVLTVFSTFANVSIYSVYYLVENGLKQLLTALTGGVQSLLGELWAKKEIDTLNSVFSWTEWLLHSVTLFFFGCAAVLILPFVMVYTEGIVDANYNQPLFALLLTIAHGIHCLRLPYNITVLAGGKYKETKGAYILAAAINVVVSVSCVNFLGLIGVAIGTICSMTFHTCWLAYYVSKDMMGRPYSAFLKQMGVDILTFVLIYNIAGRFAHIVDGYLQWVLTGFPVAFTTLFIMLIVNLVFYPGMVKTLLKKVFRR